MLVSGGGGETLDEALVLRVAQDRFELHLHGGLAVMDAVLRALSEAGAMVIDAGRAAEMGVLGNVLEGEIAVAVPSAVTETGVRLLAEQGETGLRGWAREWIEWLEGEGNGERMWQFHSAVQWLLTRSAALDRLLAPVRVAIIGAPNVGKSTLANALLGRPVSITSSIAGTTRDWVDAQAVFAARGAEAVTVPVVLVDTAGVREAPEEIEAESILRTHEQARAADVVVVLLDGTRAPTSEEGALLTGQVGRPVVVAVNKADRPAGWDYRELLPMGVAVSALEHRGLEVLMEAVLGQLDLAGVREGEPWAFSARQRGLLGQAAMVDSPARAMALLHSLTGDVTAS